MHCDNLSVLQAWAAHNSTSPHVLEVMRRTVAVGANSNFTFFIKHLARLNNGIADALSRFQSHRFRELAPYADLAPEIGEYVFQTQTNVSANADPTTSTTAKLLLNNHIAPSTSRTYASVLRKFYLFCITNQRMFFPAPPQSVIEFLAKLFDNGISYATVKEWPLFWTNTSFQLPNPSSVVLVQQAMDG